MCNWASEFREVAERQAKKKNEGTLRSPRVMPTRVVLLEAEPQTKLHRPWRVRLRLSSELNPAEPAKSTPVSLITKDEVGVGQLVVVEQVRENGLELRAHTFCNMYVFLEAKVHVPEGHASYDSLASSVRGVNTKDRVSETGVSSPGILEHRRTVPARSED